MDQHQSKKKPRIHDNHIKASEPQDPFTCPEPEIQELKREGNLQHLLKVHLTFVLQEQTIKSRNVGAFSFLERGLG